MRVPVFATTHGMSNLSNFILTTYTLGPYGVGPPQLLSLEKYRTVAAREDRQAAGGGTVCLPARRGGGEGGVVVGGVCARQVPVLQTRAHFYVRPLDRRPESSHRALVQGLQKTFPPRRQDRPQIMALPKPIFCSTLHI